MVYHLEHFWDTQCKNYSFEKGCVKFISEGFFWIKKKSFETHLVCLSDVYLSVCRIRKINLAFNMFLYLSIEGQEKVNLSRKILPMRFFSDADVWEEFELVILF